MKYFFDTEFIEEPGTIELISIGIVSEDGRKYYAISSEFDESKANDWVKENVLTKLEKDVERKTKATIRDEILEFAKPGDKPEFWAYFCSYDWVVFCWLFGAMIDLPKGYPMFCRDLKQLMEAKGVHKSDLPKQGKGHHNALADAEWNLKAYEAMKLIPLKGMA